MKVRIVKCQWPYWWYANRIGDIVDVAFDLYTDESYLIIDKNHSHHEWAILKSDCEVIPEQEAGKDE